MQAKPWRIFLTLDAAIGFSSISRLQGHANFYLSGINYESLNMLINNVFTAIKRNRVPLGEFSKDWEIPDSISFGPRSLPITSTARVTFASVASMPKLPTVSKPLDQGLVYLDTVQFLD